MHVVEVGGKRNKKKHKKDLSIEGKGIVDRKEQEEEKRKEEEEGEGVK